MEAAVKIENRQQFLVMLTIGAMALFVGVNFILTPLQGWWSSRSAEIRDLRAKVTDGRAMVRREEAIRGNWDNMRTNSLPPNTSAAEQRLLRAVDGWSSDCGVEITSLSPQWKEEDTNYLTLNCRVETSGDISSLSRFLYDLEKGPLMLRVDSVELGSHDNNGQQMTMGLDLDGLVLIANDTK
jgi:Tfp pilus assembly protein PilO